MPRLGLLHARDLPEAPSLDALRGALSGDQQTDLRFVHAPADEVAQTPGGLLRGANLFGPGHSPAMQDSPTSVARVREVTSVLLHDAAFLAGSMTIVDRHDRLFRDGVDNLGDPAVLAGWGAPYELDSQGALCLPDTFRTEVEHVDCMALPVCGIGLPNYGHFLFDGLPAVLLHAQAFADLPWRIVGQALKPWQGAILEALGLHERYLAIRGAAIFRRVLTTTLLAMHVSRPTQFVRPLFDQLRFRIGAPRNGGGRVFLSRAGHDDVRTLRNRAAVEAAMRVQGFAVVRPERLSFAEQVAVMGGARIVVGEAGAAMANVGFCRPGAKVIEIQPECFPDGWIRGTCFQLGHRWHLYLAQVDTPPAGDGPGPQRFSYEIDPLDLMTAVARIEARA